MGDLSARSSDLVRVRQDLPTFLSASALKLSSARWHCDRGLIWLRDWFREAGHAAVSPTAKVAAGDIAKENRCASPRRLAGRTLFSLADEEFDAATAVPDRPTTSPTSVVGSTTRRSSTSPSLHRSVVDSRQSDRPSNDRELSGVLHHGNQTMYKDFDVERKLPAYSRVDEADIPVGPSTQDTEDRGPASTEDSDEVAMTGRTSTSVSTLLAVAATVGVTFVIVVVILSVIVRLLRTQKPPPPGSRGGPADLNVEAYCTNSIKHHQRAGTLYFMPASNGGCLSAPTSRTRLDLPLSAGTDGAKSVGEIKSLLPANTNPRDVVVRNTGNAEPLRMYKWEDF